MTEALPLLAAGRDRRTTARSAVGALIAATLLFTALASKGFRRGPRRHASQQTSGSGGKVTDDLTCSS